MHCSIEDGICIQPCEQGIDYNSSGVSYKATKGGRHAPGYASTWSHP